jgi:hypothetical protein
VTASSEWPLISSLWCCAFVVLVLTVLHTGTELYCFWFVKTMIYSCLYHCCYQASRSVGCHWAGGSRVQMFRRLTLLIQFCGSFSYFTWKYLSYVRLATSWTVRGSNPDGGEIFRTCPDRPWGPASCTLGTGLFPWDKEWPRREPDPLPPSSAVVMKE